MPVLASWRCQEFEVLLCAVSLQTAIMALHNFLSFNKFCSYFYFFCTFCSYLVVIENFLLEVKEILKLKLWYLISFSKSKLYFIPFRYVLPNHMLLQITEILPRERQGVLACCNPIPPLVRQHLQEIHILVKQARESPLVKVNLLLVNNLQKKPLLYYEY